MFALHTPEFTTTNCIDVEFCEICGRSMCECASYSLDMEADYCEDCGAHYNDCVCEFCHDCGENVSMNYCECGDIHSTPITWDDEQ